MLDVRFPGLEDKPAATDQYSGHNKIKERQACLVHVLRHSEGGAVRPEGGDEKEKGKGREREKRPHDRLRGTYGTVKSTDTADGAMIKELESRVLDMAGEYGEGHEMRTSPSNARPNMLASPRHPDMPCRNDGAERVVREGPAKEKRSRRRPRSTSGMRCLAVICSVFQTGKRRRIRPARMLEAAAADPNWSVFDPPAAGPPPPARAAATAAARPTATACAAPPRICAEAAQAVQSARMPARPRAGFAMSSDRAE